MRRNWAVAAYTPARGRPGDLYSEVLGRYDPPAGGASRSHGVPRDTDEKEPYESILRATLGGTAALAVIGHGAGRGMGAGGRRRRAAQAAGRAAVAGLGVRLPRGMVPGPAP